MRTVNGARCKRDEADVADSRSTLKSTTGVASAGECRRVICDYFLNVDHRNRLLVSSNASRNRYWTIHDNFPESNVLDANETYGDDEKKRTDTTLRIFATGFSQCGTRTRLRKSLQTGLDDKEQMVHLEGAFI